MSVLRSAGRRAAPEEKAQAPATSGVGVQVSNVSKSYGPVHALRAVSLEVAPSELVTITGPSGSGKSTLLNLIGSLDQPDSGTIEVDGKPVPGVRGAVEFRRRLVGFVFQDHRLLPYLSAAANIETALVASGVRHGERRRMSRELLGEVGLERRAEHLPSQLSAGERQGVAIARALANNPRLLLADEPTGALDSVSGERALDLLAAMRTRHGMTIIIVSHDDAVARRADRVVRLVDGVIEGGAG